MPKTYHLSSESHQDVVLHRHCLRKCRNASVLGTTFERPAKIRLVNGILLVLCTTNTNSVAPTTAREEQPPMTDAAESLFGADAIVLPQGGPLYLQLKRL